MPAGAAGSQAGIDGRLTGGRIRLTLALDDVAEALPEVCGGIDAWFLDGFSPARNPDMWTNTCFGTCRESIPARRTFATYTSAGWVRRGWRKRDSRYINRPALATSGEMLHGSLPGFPYLAATARLKPAISALSLAGNIRLRRGFGICMRGCPGPLLKVRQLSAAQHREIRGHTACAFERGHEPLQRFVLASYGHALALLDEKLPVDGIARAECGELQLAFSAGRKKRIDKLLALDWPPHVMQRVDAAEASSLAGIELAHGGLWFPAGGWLVPPRLCEALADHPAITRLTGTRVMALTPLGDEGVARGCNRRGRALTNLMRLRP